MSSEKAQRAHELADHIEKKAVPRLLELISEIAALVGNIADDVAIPPAEVAKVFLAVRSAHEALDKRTKELYHVKDRLDKAVLPERLEKFGEDLIRVPELARSFSVLTKTSATFLDKAKGYEWLRKIGQGDLIQETVKAGTLSSFVRNLQMDQGIDPPEDIVKISSYKAMSVNKYTPKGK